MLQKVKSFISLDNPLRLTYHKLRAIAANYSYGFPHKDMTIIGITGTNGKTTTCNIVATGFREAGKKVFMYSTVNIIVDDEEFTNTSKMTSPDVFDLQKWLAYAKKKGCDIAIIETASHGIKMHRIWGLSYDIVALTNITQDHLDLHRTMEDYVETKLQIFKRLMYYERKPGIKKTAVVNIDSKYSELFTAETFDALFTYGKDHMANLRPQNVKSTINGTDFTLKIPGENLNISTSLIGDFNIANISCAVGIFMSLGLKRDEIENSIEKIRGIPGRMERVEGIDGFRVYIDYAHTEDALEKSITALKDLESVNSVITVFGCTGDRDKSKRPIMGQVVSELSDKVILTQDDDYTENTLSIIKDVLPGIERKEGEDFWIIPDRRDAIRTALIAARKGDVVLIAGKGDEHVMKTNGGDVEWHDRTVVVEILKEIADSSLVD